jgi:exo-beta-1,3-glucanase (GH17 family)/cellulose synthase/poly-beta-1,6-N-acetylglucosamine synthase-like glycosyltransferase
MLNIKNYIKNYFWVVRALLITLFISLSHFLIWQELNHTIFIKEDSQNVPIRGFAYSPYYQGQSPQAKSYPTQSQIDNDFKILSTRTNNIRTYSATENPYILNELPKYNIQLTQGIWLSKDLKHNDEEIEAAINIALHNRNVERLMVGNETILREDLTVPQLISYIQYVKSKVGNNVLVTTAEPWHVWLKYPELAQAVDQITVHLLPYNEGIPIDSAINYTFMRYDELSQKYPEHPILIGETGWPSKGAVIKGAVPSVENEAKYIRSFLHIAQERKIEYFIMEAFDQPWKGAIEGWAGDYWGMYTANRVPKFELKGSVSNNLYWRQKALIATTSAIIPIFICCVLFRNWRKRGQFLMGCLVQLSFTSLVIGITLPKDYYMGHSDLLMLAILILGMSATCTVLFVTAFEILEVLFNDYWVNKFEPAIALTSTEEPMVSIHLACCNEPPDMVIATIKSLEGLLYQNYEVLVIDNNTKDEALWKPVAQYMENLPSKFKFFHVENMKGFKAGALNFALEHTHQDAQFIGVIDADYVVDPNWLSILIPHFLDPKAAVVQAPQAHRNTEDDTFKSWANWEFDGFFRIGMHHRNERNALIQHGTMTLVRKSSLSEVGNWSTWCICEDSELGLKLLEKGYQLKYVDVVLGSGLVPSTFAALKSQRFRWAFGAMQILKGHLPQLIGRSRLDFSQRYHFLTGWLSWISEMLQFIFAAGSIIWTAAMMISPSVFNLPVVSLLSPVLALLFCKSFLGILAYRLRVKCSWKNTIGASIASLGLSHAIGLGVLKGIFKKHGTFVITPKSWKKKGGWTEIVGPIQEELTMLVLIILSIVAYLFFKPIQTQVIQWVGILVMQSIPYVCAVISQMVSLRQKINH